MERDVQESRGRVAIVAGAADGEGLTAAEALLRAGVRVAIWDDDAGQLAEAEQELRGEGLEPVARVVDVASLEQVEAAYQAARDALGPVDILHNNASLKNAYMMGPENPYPYRPVAFWELSFDRFRRTVDVNALGAYVCARVLAPDMIARRQGIIINVGTSDGTKRSPDHIPYGPSKAMMEMFSLAAAKQLEPFGVRLNVIEAGGRVNQRGETNPNNQPHDCMVPLILYLCSDAARGVTGQVLSASTFNRERGG